jgi:hypothetical protein
MTIIQNDFTLTSQELAKVNLYFETKARAYAEEGEDPQQSVKVIFEFSILGRTVTAYFDGSLSGQIILDETKISN